MELVAFLPSTDLDRSREFYEGVLGLELETQDGFACQFRAGTTRLRVTLVEQFSPQPFTVLGWSVADIEAAMAGLPVDFQRYQQLDQDERGIWAAPGGARVAWFKDPDGNTLSLAQFA